MTPDGGTAFIASQINQYDCDITTVRLADLKFFEPSAMCPTFAALPSRPTNGGW